MIDNEDELEEEWEYSDEQKALIRAMVERMALIEPKWGSK